MKRQAGNLWGRVFMVGIVVITALILWSRAKAQSTQSSPSLPTARFVFNKVDPGDIRYIAIGDSYTIGTGATPEQAWPQVLTDDLRSRGIKIGLVANLAIDGWTTEDAIHNELPVFKASSPTFATLMIGVNDTYRKTTPEEFRVQFTSLMDQILAVLPDKSHLVILTIPNYGVTPIGSQYAFQNDAGEKMMLFNGIIKEEAQKRHLTIIDLYPMSQKMGNDTSLVSRDGLHPSAKEYQLWEKMMVGTIYDLLKAPAKD